MWTVILNIFIGLLFAGVIILLDALFIRFLLKIELSNKTYFIIGIISMILLIAIFALSG